ncbi:MAG: hypothetical protein ACRD6W_13290, partial [Nitrososphaerales archaeon]
AKVRAAAEAVGELVHDHRPATWEPTLKPEDRQVLLSALHDGTYANEVAEIARLDPELADQ